jgi:formylmethanofuran dehydrogenase subunit E
MSDWKIQPSQKDANCSRCDKLVHSVNAFEIDGKVVCRSCEMKADNPRKWVALQKQKNISLYEYCKSCEGVFYTTLNRITCPMCGRDAV